MFVVCSLLFRWKRTKQERRSFSRRSKKLSRDSFSAKPSIMLICLILLICVGRANCFIVSNESLIEVSSSEPVQRILRNVFRNFQPYCWKNAYGRGVGRPINSCPDEAPERDGLLCYPKCRENFTGLGPVCWEKCQNATSIGLVCFDFVRSNGSCPWYDKCGIFVKSCSICPPSHKNLGCACLNLNFRESYGRGVGKPMVCSKEFDQDVGLCYEKCEENYSGLGPVCWQKCPSSQPISCYGGCASTEKECQKAVINMVQSVVGASINLLNILVGVPMVETTSIDILANALKGDWILVAKDLSMLAARLAEKIYPKLTNKLKDWPRGKIESATKNASFLIAATAFREKKSLLPILKNVRLDSINLAFNHGKCHFPDDFEDFFE